MRKAIKKKPITARQAGAKAAKMVHEKGLGTSPQLSITELNMPTILVPIVGITPLQMDAVPWYAKNRIRGKHFDGYEPPAPRTVKIHPIQQFCECVHNIHNGRAWATHELITPFVPPIGPQEPIKFKAKMNPGFPAVGFKSAIVSGVRAVHGLTMTYANQIIFVLGDLVPIDYESVKMIEVYPKTKEGITVVKWVAEFYRWSGDLCITFDADAISAPDLINLVNRGGAYGAGYGRPGKTKRTNGMFQVDDTREIRQMTPKQIFSYLADSRYSNRGAEWVNQGAWAKIVDRAKQALQLVHRKTATKKAAKREKTTKKSSR